MRLLIACSSRRPSSTPTATCRAESMTRRRPASRRNRSRPSRKSTAEHGPRVPARAIFIKEQRSELVKHHLWVLWTDYFKPPHFEKYPQLNQLFNEATKLAGAAGPRAARTWPRGRAAGQDRGDQQDLLGDQAGLSGAAGSVLTP